MSYILHLNYLNYFTILLAVVLALLISGIVLGLSFLLAIQAPDSEKTSAYECGFEPFEDARNRFDVRFYIVAILFLIFDLEVALLLPWGVSLGVSGFVGYNVAMSFLLLLSVGFIYEVVKGALNPQ
jgi:NADH-quinone oxidoreductase subunit A